LLKERSSREEVVMTTQQAPHTPPLWRKFLSLPQTGIGWWAVGLASPIWALWLYGLVANLLSGEITVEGVVMVLLFTGPLGIPAALAGLVAELSHERSGLVWLAMVPVLTFVSLVFLLVIIL
jgi:hypothetical protein